ncbi:MAG: cold-shock protein [Alphaproteobacteria bacterium]|nr:MAG: cold-shock protein [Alphaproteobacteria bacterium]
MDDESQEEIGEGANVTTEPQHTAVYFDEVKGVIKWFDSIKGYGFIAPEDEKGDILVHFSILKDVGRRMLPEGTSVKCLSADRSKGRQAVKILEYDLTTAVGVDVESEQMEITAIDMDDSEFVEATVKWFNRVRGYGFVNRNDGGQDVFIHMELLRKYGIDHLIPGQTVAVAVDDGDRGLVVKAIKI